MCLSSRVFLLSEYVPPRRCSFICSWWFSACSRICTLTFFLGFCCCWGLECAGLQVLKITKQHETAACKLWMRSCSANTARSDMKGDFVLDSPLVVSYLCSALFFSPRSHCTLQLQAIKIASLSCNVCHYLAGIKCKNSQSLGPASASFPLEFTVPCKSVRPGENISGALLPHLGSCKFRHYTRTNAWFNTRSGKHAWHSVFTHLNEKLQVRQSDSSA